MVDSDAIEKLETLLMENYPVFLTWTGTPQYKTARATGDFQSLIRGAINIPHATRNNALRDVALWTEKLQTPPDIPAQELDDLWRDDDIDRRRLIWELMSCKFSKVIIDQDEYDSFDHRLHEDTFHYGRLFKEYDLSLIHI